MSRDTCDELSTPATAIRRCAISVGVSDDTRRPTIYNASVPLSQQIGSHWTGTTGDGSTRRRPAHAFTPPARVHPHPHSATNRLASPCRRHVFVSLPEAKHRCAALEGDLCIFLTIGVSIKTRCEGGGMIPLFIFRAASLRSSVRALLPPDTVQSCT